ncbi:MAG: LysM peptidoglycan-binding domain-containing protein, partial [Brucella anthropi]
SVIIRRGDNLWTISKRAYGKGTRYTTIYLANRDQIRNPDLIWPGQVFNMPKEPLGDGEAKRQLEDHAN